MKKMTLILLLLATLMVPSLFWMTIFQPSITQQQNCSGLEMNQLIGAPQEKIILENCKIFQDVRKLKIGNDLSETPRGRIMEMGPLLTALIAIITGFIAIFRYLSDIETQNRTEHDLAIRNNQRSFEERLNRLIKNIGSDQKNVQAIGVATSLHTLVQPRNKEFLDTLLSVLRVCLKESFSVSDAVREILSNALEKTIRLKMNFQDIPVQNNKKLKRNLFFKKILLCNSKALNNINFEPLSEEINLSRTRLIRINFENLNFYGMNVDVAFANLTRANLKSANLHRLRGIGVILNNAKLSRANLQEARLNEAQCEGAYFHDSNLISATLKYANLMNTQFMRAKLQSAHFNGANLTGAKFEGANINDAYFYGAYLDDIAKRSLINAKNWKKSDKVEGAHFDEDVLQELKELESKRQESKESQKLTSS